MRRLLSVVLTLSVSGGVGCTGSISGLINPTSGTGGSTDGGPTSSDTGGPGGAGVPTSSLGIPCAVDTIIKTRCQGCHAAVPVAGAPMPLVNLADFRSPAKSNALITVAQMVGVRINSMTAPMPPTGAVPASRDEILTVTNWVNGGAAAGIICGAPTTGSGGSTGTGTGGTPGGTNGTAGATGTTVNNGLPCNIQTLLQTHCQGCHSNPPANGAPMPLMSYANLTAKSIADSTMTFAQRAIARMQNTAAPMPPLGNPAVSATEIAAMSAWVATQYPMGSCTTTATTGAGGSTGTTTGVGGATGTTTGVGGAPGGPNTSGIPCNVLAVFQSRCQGCHSNPPANNAPMPLVTLANLKAASFADTMMTFAQRALSRMQNTAAPMPPAPNARASAADIATVSAWVAAQSPAATSTASCGVVTGSGGAPGGVGGSPGTTTGTGGAGGGTGTVANGIPCDVATLLQTRCIGCHTNPPLNSAPMPLLTYANLTATSPIDPTATFAQRTVVRMTAGTMPPAPNAHATTTEISAMSNWIAAKYPMGSCTTTVTGAGGATGGGMGGAPGGTGGAGGGVVVGLPCDVQAVFQTHCTTCHSGTPNSTGAPMNLVTRANLVAPSFANTAQTFAQRAVMRMQGNPSQMPPAPGTPPSATEIQTVNAWVAAGYPAGTCGTTTTPPPPDPINARPICTSNTFWPAGAAGSPIMNPGLSCLSCHTGGGGDDSGGGNSGPGGGGNSGPGGGGDDNGGGGEDGAALYTIAGTVYPTGHEPDLCYGTNVMAAARVVIVDAANQTISLTPNASGNFFYAGAVTFPFHAKVTYQGRERIMTAAQSNGSCNACHTQNGANGAPGRITLP